MEDKVKIDRIKNLYFISWFVTFIVIILGLWYVLKHQMIGDSKKISEVNTEIETIEKSLNKFYNENWYYPSPDNSVWIIAWKWNFVYYQGYIWESLNKRLELNKSEDFFKKYTYSVTTNGDKYQIVYFLRNKKILSFWDKIWVFVDANNVPFQDLDYPIWDLTKTQEVFTVYFDDKIKITWKADALTPIKAVVNYDYSDDLIGYWDMETITRDWKLFDLSWSQNHWILNWDIKIWDSEWTIWKWTYFDWLDDFINLDSFSDLIKEQDEFTISYAFKTNWDFYKYISTIAFNWDTEEFDNILRLGFWVEKWLFFSFSDWEYKYEMQKWIVDWDWHHVAYTYSKSDNIFKMYVDWKYIWRYYKPKDSERNIDKTKHFSIGQDYDIDTETLEMSVTDNYEWILDEVLVYSRTLTEDEIKKIHKK